MTSLTQNFLNPNNKPFVIGEFTIRQDEDGRFCLNDLHKASGGADKHQPAYFMRNKQTNDLILEINNSANLQSLENDRSANLHIAFKKNRRRKGWDVCSKGTRVCLCNVD